MLKQHFMQDVRKGMEKKGTVGSFTRIAKSHGRSVHAEAEADKHKGGKLGKKANMALIFEETAHKHKK